MAPDRQACWNHIRCSCYNLYSKGTGSSSIQHDLLTVVQRLVVLSNNQVASGNTELSADFAFFFMKYV